jgi:hypothetical protein
MCATPVGQGGNSEGSDPSDGSSGMEARLESCAVALYVRVVFVRTAVLLGSVASRNTSNRAEGEQPGRDDDARTETSVERWLWESLSGEDDDTTAVAKSAVSGRRNLPAPKESQTIESREEDGRLRVYDPGDSDSYISSDVYETVDR